MARETKRKQVGSQRHSQCHASVRRILLQCLVGGLLFVLLTTAASADELPFGIGFRLEFRDRPDLVPDLGAKWARTSVYWDRTEPFNTTPDNYDWTEPDKDYAALEQLGLTPIVLVFRNPSWAASTICGPIDLVGLEEFAEFTAALAERYDGDGDWNGDGVIDGAPKPKVTHWEFYNEPDCNNLEVGDWLGGCWGDHGEEYARTLAVAWEAMHAVNDETVILFGGMAAEPLPAWLNFQVNGGDFLDDVLSYIETHPGNYFDWMNFHSYYVFEARWRSYGPGILGKVEYIRQRLAGHGISKPMAVTEFGMRSDKTYNGMPPGHEGQSRYLVQTLARSASTGIRATTMYRMRDDSEAKYGLVDTEYNKNPSYAAYRTLTQELAGASPRGPVSLGEGIEAYEFGLPDGGLKTVLWSTGEEVYGLLSEEAPSLRTLERHDAAAEIVDGGLARVAGLAKVGESIDVISTASEQVRGVPFAGTLLRLVDKYGAAHEIADGGPGDVDGVVNGEVSLEITGSPVYVELLTGVAPTVTPTNTPTPTQEPTSTPMPTETPTNTPVPTESPTNTPVPTYGPETKITLHYGWNLISIPVSLGSTDIVSVLSTIQGKYDLVVGYKPSDPADPWKKYNVDAPSFVNDLAEIDETMGLWIRTTQQVILTLSNPKGTSGTSSVAEGISLYAGWNLVGYPSTSARPIEDALSSIEGKYDLVAAYDSWDTADPWKKYNAEAPAFVNDLTEMKPGLGYWIRVTEDCRWKL